MSKTEKRRDGQLFLLTGGSRSGKTTGALQAVKSHRRLIVWDVLGRDWPLADCERVTGIAALCRATAGDAGRGDFRISYAGRPDPREFAEVCRHVHDLSEIRPLTFVAEELANVTQPGKADADGWGYLVATGLGFGTSIIAITQRVQETDKSLAGNVSQVRVYRQNTAEDRAYIARKFDIPVSALESLQPHEFVEKSIGSDTHRTGRNRAP